MRQIRLIFLLLPFTLFADQQPYPASAKIKVETLAKSTKSWDGSDLPPYPTGEAEITVLRITVPPHTKLPVHKHPVINAGVLVTGNLTVYMENGKSRRLEAGNALIEVVEKWHYGANEGDEAAEIVVVYAGTPGVPVNVLKSEEKSPGTSDSEH